MSEQFAHIATHDPLTGVPNRRGFLTLAEQQLKIADRAKTGMLLLYANFDGLERINDTLGYLEGDRTLIEMANVLKDTFRESDIVARIGGGEFVVLAIGTDGSNPRILTTRLQERLEARNARGDGGYRLSLSVGTSRYDPATPCSVDKLLARADESMCEREMAPQPELPVHYESYLLRLRRDERDGEPVCQIMLQSVSSKEQRYFHDLESLKRFLQGRVEDGA